MSTSTNTNIRIRKFNAYDLSERMARPLMGMTLTGAQAFSLMLQLMQLVMRCVPPEEIK